MQSFLSKPFHVHSDHDDEKESMVSSEAVATDFEFESVIDRTLSRWERTELDGQRVKECLLKAQIVRSADIEAVASGSDKWESVRSGIGLEELEGIYLLNRLKVMASGWNRGNEVQSISDCNRMELLYVLMEHILPNAKNVKDKGMRSTFFL